MAQAMEAFEELVEVHVPKGHEAEISNFKGLLRAKFNALAVDASDAMNLTDTERNGYAVETLDRIYPNGRPPAGIRS